MALKTTLLTAVALSSALVLVVEPASAQRAGFGRGGAGAPGLSAPGGGGGGFRGGPGFSGRVGGAPVAAYSGGRYYGGGYRGGRYYGSRGPSGLGIGLGLAAGAVIGSAIVAGAAPYYYDDYYAYDHAPGYAVAPAPVYVAPGGDDGSCAARFQSYDPASGTYLGYDGLRHPCP